MQVIKVAIDTVRPTADTKMIHLEATLTPSVVLVSGNPDRLQQVAWNLLSNKVKFTRNCGRSNV